MSLSRGTVIRVLCLPVVLPIALLLVITHPIWAAISWLSEEGTRTYSDCASGVIDVIGRLVWPTRDPL